LDPDRPSLAENFPIRSASRSWGFLLWLAPLGFLILFYFNPLFRVLQLSFARGESGALGSIADVFRSSSQLRILGFTIWQAALSTLLTLLIGIPGAYLLARYDFRGKSLLRALTGIPFVLPTLVVATAFSSLLGPTGWINSALMTVFNLDAPPIDFSHTLMAILVAHVFFNTTIVLRMVGDFWARIDPRLMSAARTLGANRWQTALRVTLPMLMPAIAAASLLVFIFDFTSFGVILILGGPQFATIEVEIYYQTVSLFNLPLAAALSIVQLGFTLAMTVLYTRLSSRISRPLTLRSRRITQRRFSSWRERIMAAAILLVLVSLLIMPLASLASRSVYRLDPDRRQQELANPGFTLDFYRELGSNRRQSYFFVPPVTSIAVSLGYAAATSLIALALGMPAAWALSRNRDSFMGRIVDPLIMLPLGTSAVTLGLGFIVALAQPPLDLRTSPILIPIAHTLVAFPFVVRSLVPALQSIQPQLRMAAQTLGASPAEVLRRIDLPLIGRAAMVAAVFAFTISMGEFGATALIARPDLPTIPIMIFRFLGQPGGLPYGQAMALSTILMLVTGIGMLAIERFRTVRVGDF
jgi:thiamine transport system permease protein